MDDPIILAGLALLGILVLLFAGLLHKFLHDLQEEEQTIMIVPKDGRQPYIVTKGQNGRNKSHNKGN